MHDPCEGMELTLLKIVHVSCRLADYFESTSPVPLKAPDFSEIVGILDESVRDQLMLSGPDQLRHSIAESIHALDSEVEVEDPKTAWKTVARVSTCRTKKLRPDPLPLDSPALLGTIGRVYSTAFLTWSMCTAERPPPGHARIRRDFGVARDPGLLLLLSDRGADQWLNAHTWTLFATCDPIRADARNA